MTNPLKGYQTSYWEQKEWLEPPDLMVVGAGIVGASSALFYKEKYPEKSYLQSMVFTQH